jgi:hypothetical protein
MKRDIMIRPPERKSILRHLVKPSSAIPILNGKMKLISYLFSREATYIVSYRFLFEATGGAREVWCACRQAGRETICKTSIA